nr:TIGR02678 family protein [Nocardiopsis mwathae]
MATPIVTARTHPEDFAVIRTHSDWLTQRFQRILGYRLTVAADHARLAKTGLVRSVATPLTRAGGAFFSPRAYTYLALTLAALVEAPAKLPVARLAADVHSAAEEAGLDLDPRDRMAERRVFTAALRHLATWGVLTEREGSLAEYAADGTREVWLDVSVELARRVVAHPPHSAPDPSGYLESMEGADPSGDEAGEVALRRLLAETAVVYRGDLADRQRERLAHHQWRAVAELGDLLGCDAEIRAEGVALIMPDDAEEERGGACCFPSGDPIGQAALLLLERLVTRLRPEHLPCGAVPVPPDVLREELAAVVGPGAEPRRRWARTALSHIPDQDDLTARALLLLRDAGLMGRPAPGAVGLDGWNLLAAAARYGGRRGERPRDAEDTAEDDVEPGAGT